MYRAGSETETNSIMTYMVEKFPSVGTRVLVLQGMRGRPRPDERIRRLEV